MRGLNHVVTVVLRDADGFAYVLEVGLGSFLMHWLCRWRTKNGVAAKSSGLRN